MTTPNTVVAVFYMKDCPSCHAYLPKLKQIAKQYPDVPLFIMEANEYGQEADRFNVRAVPVTLVLRRPYGAIRVEGDIPKDQIDWIFRTAQVHSDS